MDHLASDAVRLPYGPMEDSLEAQGNEQDQPETHDHATPKQEAM
nr:hypothetical protein [Halomonas socia]